MSPRHSTKKTDERQQKAAHRYARARGLYLERAPGGAFSPVDYVGKSSGRYGADVLEVIEVKCRDSLSTSYPTVWLEERKVVNLKRWANLYSADGVFVVEWGDGRLFWIDVADAVRAAGDPVARRRMSRADEEPDIVYEVPVNAMREVMDAGGGAGEAGHGDLP
jgi:hypothetical protein